MASPLDSLVDEINSLQKVVSGPPLEFLKTAEYREAIRSIRNLEREYAENLSLKPVSRCPICESPARVAIDVSRLDSPWWDDNTLNYPSDDVCEHFYLLQGAIKFDSEVIFTGRSGVIRPGPDKPFVIGRLLREKTIFGVVSEITLADRFAAYPVCYFSENPEIEVVKHQSWARETYPEFDDDGNHVVNFTSTLPWDFNIARWHRDQKLLWIAPGDASLTLRDDMPSPYEDTPGEGVNQVIRGGVLSTAWLPNGAEPDPWHSHVHD